MRKIWAKKCRGGFGALFLSTALGHEWHDPRHDPRQLKIDLLLLVATTTMAPQSRCRLARAFIIEDRGAVRNSQHKGSDQLLGVAVL
jgi:hypothetical protein